MRTLHAWMNGRHVGEWSHTPRGTALFRYDAGWVDSPAARPLSLSLPITSDRTVRGPRVAAWFEHLLPTTPEQRARLRDRYRIDSTLPFELLAAAGRDCAGAIQLYPEGESPEGWDRIDAQPLDEAGVARHLRGPSGGFRHVLAGAQDKSALLQLEGRWYLPRGATPSTHVLKRAPIDALTNEWLCAAWLRELGLPVAGTDIARIADERVLVVQRFDRSVRLHERLPDLPAGSAVTGNGWIARLPMEDICQATGRSVAQVHEYEGGPTAAEILQLLSASERAPQDTRTFVLAQLALWLLAAGDGHAKRYSLMQRPGGAFHLAPLHGVQSAWPLVGNGPGARPLQTVKLAMAVPGRAGQRRLVDIVPRDWQALAMRSGGARLWDDMLRFVLKADAAMAGLLAALPVDGEPRIAEAVAAGVRRQARAFADNAAD